MTITYIETIFTGSLFSCAVLLLRFGLQKRLPNALFYWLWNVAGLLFLLPFRIPSPMNVYLLIAEFNRPEAVKQGVWVVDTVGQAVQPNALGFIASTYSILERFLAAADFIILFGTLLISSFLLLELLVWGKRLREATQVRDVLTQFEGISKMPVFKSVAIDTPCIKGIFKLKAYFPDDWDFGNQLETSMALYHEQTHVKHQDNLRRTVLLLLLCLQWYNPIVWMVYFFTCRDMELYCDECVVTQFGQEVRSKYALMLLSKHSVNRHTVFPGACLSKWVIRERIVSIMKPKGTSRFRNFFSRFIFMSLVLLFSTGATTKVMPMDTAKPSIGNPPSGDEVTVTHYSGSPLTLDNGDILVLGDADVVAGKAVTFSLVPVEGYTNGQTISYGYLQNGTYRALNILNISNGTVTTLPEILSTTGTICIRSSSPDTIYMNGITMKNIQEVL